MDITEWLEKQECDLLHMIEDWFESKDGKEDIKMAAATQETQRVIYRCGGKDCRHTWAYDYQVTKKPYGGYRSGVIRILTREVSDERGKRVIDQSYGEDSICPKCNRRRATVSNEVKGTYSDHKCDSRCTGARGPNCECSCGGENHGSSWL